MTGLTHGLFLLWLISFFLLLLGLAYKKHDRPSLTDKVWRLKKIAKDGASHKRLENCGIYNVKDFLRLCVTDPSTLRKVRKLSSCHL